MPFRGQIEPPCIVGRTQAHAVSDAKELKRFYACLSSRQRRKENAFAGDCNLERG